MQVGQKIQVSGNGIYAECIIKLIPESGYRKNLDFILVQHPNGAAYWVQLTYCKTC